MSHPPEWSSSEKERLIRAIEKVASEVGCLYWALLWIACAITIASGVFKK